jgi:hypothetical protein
MPKPRRKKYASQRVLDTHKIKPSPIQQAQLPIANRATFQSPETMRAFTAQRQAAKGLQQLERPVGYDPVSGDWGDQATMYYQQTGTQPLVNPAMGSFQIPNERMRRYIYEQRRKGIVSPTNWYP